MMTCGGRVTILVRALAALVKVRLEDSGQWWYAQCVRRGLGVCPGMASVVLWRCVPRISPVELWPLDSPWARDWSSARALFCGPCPAQHLALCVCHILAHCLCPR